MPYDLGEAVKPIEDFGNGVAKAGGAVMNAVVGDNGLPSWLLALALCAFVIRVFFTSQVSDKVAQGRNDRQAQEHAMAMAKLQHEQEMERLREEHRLRTQAERD